MSRKPLVVTCRAPKASQCYSKSGLGSGESSAKIWPGSPGSRVRGQRQRTLENLDRAKDDLAGSSRVEASIPFPALVGSIPSWSKQSGRYHVRFARSPGELAAAQRLRFEVFNIELGEGLENSFELGLDSDEFDARCHHLLAEDLESGKIIATYRLQTRELAAAGTGFYSEREFLMATLNTQLDDGVELGRACIAKEHRGRRLLFMLWQGLGAYMLHNHKRFLFGCGSIQTIEPEVAWATAESLRRLGHNHPALRVGATEAFRTPPVEHARADQAAPIPPLFRSYFSMGARVCSEPALDREFGTADFLLLFDLHRLDAKARRAYGV